MPYIDLKELSQLDERLASTDVTFSWESAAASDVGRVREVNEDAYMCSAEQQLWVVADGMGGHSRGDYASQAVVESLLYFSAKSSLPKSVIELDTCLKKAHDVCRNTFKGEKVGSTVAALYTFADHCFFIWAGDSRIYRLRENCLELMTCDHTVAQQKLARGELSPLMAALHPSANLLTRAVGVHQTLYLDLEYAQVQVGDRYLICSDGLYNELEDKELEQLMLLETPQLAVNELIAAANNNGGRDNTTAIVLQVNK